MAKDFLTPKEIAKRLKAKGLQKLKWYCQMCQKQCRDENGFKCHCTTEGHLRQMQLFGENPHTYLNDHSRIFLDDFMRLLSRRFGTKRVLANTVYQELISDRHHQHMNSTRWQSLTEFVIHLGREGLAEVDENEKGWYVKWIDNSAKTLSKKDAIKRKERMEYSKLEEEEVLSRVVNEALKKNKPSELEPKPEELNDDENRASIKITFSGDSNKAKSKNIKINTRAKFLQKAKDAVSKSIEIVDGSDQVSSGANKRPKSMAQLIAEEGRPLIQDSRKKPRLQSAH